MNLKNRLRLAGMATAIVVPASPAFASEILTLDASHPPAAVASTSVRLGQTMSPDGQVIGVNNRYLTLNGKPWLPVMGEFHYSRFPHQYWEEQLRKMKAAGVNIVSTYVIWQHHQEKPGVFDFTGDKDLRAFILTAKKVGLFVYLRPGPWAHAEVRFGGIPDFVVDSTLTRSNDPEYLADVKAYFDQIGQQTKGLLWKDGGPVIGVQIENEYNRVGPLRGRDHIQALKALLVSAGMDVPLYSITGWDNTVWPEGAAIPVFGSYVDEPWATSLTKLPPKSSYTFQYKSRVEYGLGAVGGISATGDAERDQSTTPFLGAEYGAGVPTMYRRRPVILPDDISAMVTTKLSSGVNLLGYYMFQGGQNPQGLPSREENTSIGGFNDLPKLGYDFQAPLGEYGEVHPVLRALRPIHAFLNAFGDRLAPMSVYAPDAVPADAADLKTLRWSVRSDGHRGFIFVNNHVRQYASADHTGVTFKVALTDEVVELPAVTVQKDEAFIWPVNFDLSGIDLAFATAQPVTRLNDGTGDIYVFSQTGAIPAQFAFRGSDAVAVIGARKHAGSKVSVYTLAASTKLYTVATKGRAVRILVLSTDEAQEASVMNLMGESHLVLTKADAFADDKGLTLRQTDNPSFEAQVFPALPDSISAGHNMGDGIFSVYSASVPARTISAQLTLVQAPQPVPPLKMTGPDNTAVEPAPEVFGNAGRWQITLPKDALVGLSDAYLTINYEGDVARLFSGPDMLDDEFYNGAAWQIGLKRYVAKLDAPFTLAILPLRQDAKISLEAVPPAADYENGQVAKVASVTVSPEYSYTFK